MIRLIFTIFTIICFALPFVILFNYKFGKALPLSYITITFLMFICSLINNLSLFKYIIILCELIIIAIFILKYGQHKKKIINNLFRYSTFTFIIIFIFLFFILKDRMYSYVDDYHYWGILVRDSIENNALYTAKNTLASIGSYPPFLTLLEISFNKLIGNIGLMDGISMLAISSFVISLFIHLLDKYELNKTDVIKAVLTLLLIVLSTLIISTNNDVGVYFLYNTTLIDWPMGFMFAYCMYLAFISDGNLCDSLNLGICCSALILVKQVSIPLTMLVLATYLCTLLVNKKISKKYLLSLSIPIFVYLIWQAQVVLFNKIIPLAGSVNVVGDALNLTGDGDTAIIISRFIKAFFTNPIYLRPIHLSFFAIILSTSLILLLLGYLKKSNKYYVFSIFNFVGGLGYSLVILISYVSKFNHTYGMTLVCFGRYMQTYTLGSLILLIMLFASENKKYKNILVSLLLVCLFIEPTSVITLKKTKIEENRLYDFKNTFSNFYNYTYNNEKTVVLYSTNIAGVELMNFVMDRKNENFIIYNSVDNHDSYESFDKVLNDAKYLIVVDSNDDFWKNCNHMFQDNFILNESIYTINYDENGDKYLLRL